MAEEIDISGISDPRALRIIEILLRKIAVLEERITQLERNSSNSSKPPSSDIVKPESEQRSSSRNAGGQKGHKGVRHKLVSLDKVDAIERIEITKCPDCEGDTTRTGKVIRHQVYELVKKPVILTEYQRRQCYCQRCNKYMYGSLPEGISNGQRFGNHLQSFLIYLKGATGATYTELYDLCRDVFKIEAARSSICNMIMRGSEHLATFHQKMLCAVRKSARLNIDETSWKKNGRLQWVWVFCNKQLAYFSIEKTRGAKVVQKHLGKNSNIAITSDFYGGYNWISHKNHQVCLAHLVRDFKFMATLPDATVRKRARCCLSRFRNIFSLLHRNAPPTEIHRVVQRLRNFLTRTKSDNRKFKTLLRRVNRYWDCLWHFIDQPELFEPTNNRAERTIRHLVRLRKISQGSRSRRGLLWIARFCSLFQTAKLQGNSPWECLCRELARG